MVLVPDISFAPEIGFAKRWCSMIKEKFNGPVTSNNDKAMLIWFLKTSAEERVLGMSLCFSFLGILQLSHDALRALISHFGEKTWQEFRRS